VIVELREGDEGVQVITARLKVWSPISRASCNGDDARLELDDLTVACWTQRRTASTERSGWRRSYQGVQVDEAGLMAKQVGRGCSGLPAIPRRRSCCGQ
jgi:hypothetical protein